MRQVIALLVTGGLVVGGLVGAEAIDDRGNGEPRATETAAGAQPTQRTLASFCDASQRLNRARRNFFSGFQQRGDASPEELASAQREFAELNAPLLRELQRAAPPAVRTDVTTAVTAAQAASGGGDGGPSDRMAQAAVQRLTRFITQNC